ncbi:hypothetical protein KC19_2G224900 [Ceratodon purpureus]|uniref:Uncharacterized protein n=1 Tax=Ceratodon purpureus TaxID=3225 RepID=A0A8T0IY79_CERPU|nr:hypothetical protein KC19_2G224900 [Ceratodon purpureus]
MRMAALFCRNVRRLSSVASRGSLGIVARPAMRDTVSKVSPFWSVESRADGALVQFGAASRVGALRFAGFGTFNEEHANAIVTDDNEDEAKTDEHPEETIEKASQELFRQSNIIGDPEEGEVEEFQVKELGREKPGADIAREVWSAKEQDGTSVFSDESDKVKSEA